MASKPVAVPLAPILLRLVLVLSLAMVALTCFASPSQPSLQQQQVIEGDYKLGANDVITVVVIDHAELTSDFYVPQGGVIDFPLVGEIHVEGMTLSELTKVLTKKLSETIKTPRVSVVLKTPRPQQVSITGDVQKPGAFPLLLGWHALDLYGAAGGLIAGLKVDDADVTIIHKDGSSTTLPLKDVLNSPNSNATLLEGDVLNVDAGELNVYVVGQVKTPGLQRLRRGSNVLEAIASAGGATDMAALNKVHVTSLSGSEQTFDVVPSLFQGAPAPGTALKHGDMVVVPETTEQISVLGYVGAPGVFQYPQGKKLYLVDAIGLARGHDAEKRARMSRVGVARLVNGKPQYFVYDFGKYLIGGDAAQNPEILPGDLVYVPETNQIDIKSVLSAISSFALLWRASR